MKVTRGFKGVREINTVTYNPAVISNAEIEQLLKQSGTYRGTLE